MDLLLISVGMSLLGLGVYGALLAGKRVGLKQAYNLFYGHRRYSTKGEWWEIVACLVAVTTGSSMVVVALL